MGISVSAELLTKENIDKIERNCQKWFFDENEGLECFNYILDALKKDDCRRLKAFTAKSSPGAFMNAVSCNLIIDFRRKKYGRRRFPEAVSRMGQWAQAVYRYVCWRKFSYDDAFHLVKTEPDPLYTGTYDDYLNDIESLAKVKCRQHPEFEYLEDYHDQRVQDRRDDDLDSLDQIIDRLDFEQKAKAVAVLKKTFLSLDEEERFIVDKLYYSSIKPGQVARLLGINTSRLNRRRRKILLKYKEALLEQGIRKL
ncbi:hypothetical protein [uncultured Desulfobacter sp.]|uniref:hypothetical protein n=1 Tax=uncultured Desulfobacter sp. TaxID=240139 RepID=UPI002AA8FF1C|nr:hypothetical protein [uncultured Desulfobacter sp.]